MIRGIDPDSPVYLAPLNYTDMDKARLWRNNPDIYQWCRQNNLISGNDQRDWFSAQREDPTIRMFAVRRDDSDAGLLGVCGLTDIDFINSRAEFSLYIGPEHHGSRYGAAALKILLHYGFDWMRLHQIWGEVFDGNPALGYFEDVGFERTGVRPDYYYKNGKFVNAHLITYMRKKWKSSPS